MGKTKISTFLDFHWPHAVTTNSTAPSKPPSAQFGYIMGADGRVLNAAYLERKARSQSDYSTAEYIRLGQKWLGRRCFDCNSMNEFFTEIDTKARYCYADQCGRKSPAAADSKLAGLPQMPGVAVFSNSKNSSASSITHIGYLLYKYGAGDLDWYVIEARGVKYGVVITRLKDRAFRWWGVMDKHFEYDLGVAWKPGDKAKEEPATVEYPAAVIKTPEKALLVTDRIYSKKENALARYEQIMAAVYGKVYWGDAVYIAELEGGKFAPVLGEYAKFGNAEIRKGEAEAAFAAAGAASQLAEQLEITTIAKMLG